MDSDDMILYHHTTSTAALTITQQRRFESTIRGATGYPSAYFTNVRGGHADGRGTGLVIIEVPDDQLDQWLDDEFPDGERHYEIPVHLIRPEWITDAAAIIGRYQTRVSDYDPPNVKIVDTEATKWAPESPITGMVFGDTSDECTPEDGALACALLNEGRAIMPISREALKRRCPDGGTCHHKCLAACFRVLNAGPLSGVYPNDEWPRGI